MSPRSHESWKEQLPAYLLGALSPGEKTDFEHHLGGCAECQAEMRWLEPAKEKLAEQVKQVEPSPGLKSGLMAMVEDDLLDNPVEESDAAPAAAASPRPRRAKTERFGWLNFGQLLRPATLGALAVVLFAGVVAGYVVNDGGESGPTPSQPQVIAADPVASKAEATLVANGDAGTLKVAHLEKLGSGEVYQAWVQRGQSIEPTDSLFVPRKDGSATTSIPNLHDVDVVMVSVEPDGGSEQPTTAPIIVIPIPT